MRHASSSILSPGALRITIFGIAGSIGPVSWNGPFYPNMTIYQKKIDLLDVGPIIKISIGLDIQTFVAYEFIISQFAIQNGGGSFQFGFGQEGAIMNDNKTVDRYTCSNPSQCMSCTQRSGCGWCGSTCLTGTAVGSSDSLNPCTGDQWIYNQTSACPTTNIQAVPWAAIAIGLGAAAIAGIIIAAVACTAITGAAVGGGVYYKRLQDGKKAEESDWDELRTPKTEEAPKRPPTSGIDLFNFDAARLPAQSITARSPPRI